MPERTHGGGTRERWAALLDELERDAANAGDGEERTAWQPPSDLGALPDELRPRAEALVRAQAAAISIVEQKQHRAARHLAALRGVPQGRDDTRPIYLDAEG